MNFSNFLEAIYNRLAGLVAQGLLRRFEAYQAMDSANLQAELETKITRLREAGATAAAARLEAETEYLAKGNAAAGMTFANELLMDRYSGKSMERLEFDMTAEALSGEPDGEPKKRGSKVKS